MKKQVSKVVFSFMLVFAVMFLLPTALKAEARSSARSTTTSTTQKQGRVCGSYIYSYPTNTLNKYLPIVPKSLLDPSISHYPAKKPKIMLDYNPRARYICLLDTSSAVEAGKAVENFWFYTKVGRGGYAASEQSYKLTRVYYNGRYYFAMESIPKTTKPTITVKLRSVMNSYKAIDPDNKTIQVGCDISTSGVDGVMSVVFYGIDNKLRIINQNREDYVCKSSKSVFSVAGNGDLVSKLSWCGCFTDLPADQYLAVAVKITTRGGASLTVPVKNYTEHNVINYYCAE